MRLGTPYQGQKNRMSRATFVVELDPKKPQNLALEETKKSGLTEDSAASSEATETIYIPFFASRLTLPGAKILMSIADSVVELDPKEASKSGSGNHQKIRFNRG